MECGSVKLENSFTNLRSSILTRHSIFVAFQVKQFMERNQENHSLRPYSLFFFKGILKVSFTFIFRSFLTIKKLEDIFYFSSFIPSDQIFVTFLPFTFISVFSFSLFCSFIFFQFLLFFLMKLPSKKESEKNRL